MASPTPPPVSLPAPTSSVPLPHLPSLSALSGSETSLIHSGSSSMPSSSPSAQPFPTSSAVNLASFKFVYVIPVITVLGVIFTIAFIWLLQGCCTRKPKVIEEDPEFFGGPRYEFIESGGQPHQERAYEEKLEHKYYEPTYAAQQLGYEQVAWAEHTSCHQPEGSYAYVQASSVDHGRSRARSTRSNGKTVISTPASDATSAAMLDMYESDEEKDEERRQEEPWETLRHRSIKRGILEIVEKENGWRDSLRAFVGSSFVNQGSSDGRAVPRSRRRESEAWIDDVKQRRARSSRSSTFETTVTANHHNHSTVSTPWSEETGFKIVPESPPSPLMHMRSGDVGQLQVRSRIQAQPRRRGAKAGSRDRNYLYYKLPPVGEGSVPMDQTIGGIGPHEPTRISMLPISPPRIMSPPLEHQLLFTPNPNEGAGYPSASGTVVSSRPSSQAGNQNLLSRLTTRDRKRKSTPRRKPSPDVTRVNNPLPLPTTDAVIAPLRTGKRATAKLVKTRMVAAAGNYQALSEGSANDKK